MVNLRKNKGFPGAALLEMHLIHISLPLKDYSHSFLRTPDTKVLSERSFLELELSKSIWSDDETSPAARHLQPDVTFASLRFRAQKY